MLNEGYFKLPIWVTISYIGILDGIDLGSVRRPCYLKEASRPLAEGCIPPPKPNGRMLNGTPDNLQGLFLFQLELVGFLSSIRNRHLPADVQSSRGGLISSTHVGLRPGPRNVGVSWGSG